MQFTSLWKCKPRLYQLNPVSLFVCLFIVSYAILWGFPGGSVVKTSPANAGDTSLISGSGRSPGEGNGNPLKYLAWEIPWTEGLVGYSPVGSLVATVRWLQSGGQLNKQNNWHHYCSHDLFWLVPVLISWCLCHVRCQTFLISPLSVDLAQSAGKPGKLE